MLSGRAQIRHEFFNPRSQPAVNFAPLGRQPFITGRIERYAVKERQIAAAIEDFGDMMGIALVQRICEHRKVTNQIIAIKRHLCAAYNQQVCASLIGQLPAQIEQALPEAGLGLRIKPVGPQQAAKRLAIKAAIGLQTKQRNQHHRPAIREQDWRARRIFQPELTENPCHNRVARRG
ncbi:MAG: hypothetical protein ACXIT4_06400 [Erythrobacter sp.]